MRGILIDPFAREVTEVTYEGHYSEIYRLIDCEIFTVIRLSRTEILYIDDCGLLHEDEPTAFFAIKGYAQPLANKGLILGEDNMGETVGTKLTVEEVKSKVTFPAVEVVGWTSVETSTEFSDLLGGDVEVIHGAAPIFEPVVPIEGSKERH